MQHVVSALDSTASPVSRPVLRLVSPRPPVSAPAAPTDDAPDAVPGRERERRLVEQSRDAHFALRRRFRELAADVAGSGLELLYDRARRLDGELAGLYQARAAVLAHRLERVVSEAAPTTAPAAAVPPTVSTPATDDPRATTDLSIEERALVMRLRAASESDRRTLLHLAVRFSEKRTHGQR